MVVEGMRAECGDKKPASRGRSSEGLLPARGQVKEVKRNGRRGRRREVSWEETGKKRTSPKRFRPTKYFFLFALPKWVKPLIVNAVHSELNAPGWKGFQSLPQSPDCGAPGPWGPMELCGGPFCRKPETSVWDTSCWQSSDWVQARVLESLM